CAPEDLPCRALCAKVPNPSADQANRTNTCASQCKKDDPKAYGECVSNCINEIFIPVTQKPGASGSTGGDDAKKGNGTTGAASSAPIVASYSAGLVGAAL
ncbi:hypothetical protein THASP1DRAFT_4729, partial [Thamnocephalis sphaerospora]